jgi:uncharacterized protein YjbJ (UPF0337 family)
MIMTSNWVEDAGHRVNGALKESVGRMICDAKLVSDGAAERAAAHAQSAAGPGRAQLIRGIDNRRIIGVAHQIRGSVKLHIGNLIGNAKLAANGRAECQVGKTEDSAGSAKDESQDALHSKHDAGSND